MKKSKYFILINQDKNKFFIDFISCLLYPHRMDITKDIVLSWLERERRSQKWLAARLGVSEQAVSNWLRERNPQSISSKAQISIQRLMEEDEALSKAPTPQNLVLQFDQDDFDNICRAANRSNQLPREWAQDKLCELASMDVELLAATIRAAEATDYPKAKKSL